MAAFLIPGGIQAVLYPWLIAVVLRSTPDRLGIAQMASQLPMLVLILVGGVMGDRMDQRRILLVIHLLAAIPPIGLALVIGNNSLTYGLTLAYALATSTLMAFSQPARDALLSRVVAGDQIQRTVTIVMGLQFGVQIIGYALASLADRIGAEPLLFLQALVVVLGVAAVMRIRIDAATPAAKHEPPLKAVVDGLRLVAGSDRLAPNMLVIFAVGIFFAGAYMVIIPLMIRDVYAGGAPQIGLAFGMNMFGTLITTVLLVMRGGLVRQGRAVILALLAGCLTLLPILLGVPLWGFYVIIFLWGMGAGVVMSMSRTIAQESSPMSHRARVMSVFTLGMMGGMPIGSLILGYAASAWGAQNALFVSVFGMLVVIAGVTLKTRYWYLTPAPLASSA